MKRSLQKVDLAFSRNIPSRSSYSPTRTFQFLTTEAEYIRALYSLLVCLINPISALLLPLLRLYCDRRLSKHGPLFRSLYQDICALFQEMDTHYLEFCLFYGGCSVSEVEHMLNRMDKEEKIRFACVLADWKDVLFLMEHEGLLHFRMAGA